MHELKLLKQREQERLRSALELQAKVSSRARETEDGAKSKEAAPAAQAKLQQRIHEDKASKVREIKSERLRIRSEMVEQRQREEREREERSLKARQDKERARARRRAEEDKRREAAQAEAEARLRAEEEDKQRREARLRELERLELEYINKLADRSFRQQQMRDMLESGVLPAGPLKMLQIQDGKAAA
jgi:hypothetical protein